MAALEDYGHYPSQWTPSEALPIQLYRGTMAQFLAFGLGKASQRTRGIVAVGRVPQAFEEPSAHAMTLQQLRQGSECVDCREYSEDLAALDDHGGPVLVRDHLLDDVRQRGAGLDRVHLLRHGFADRDVLGIDISQRFDEKQVPLGQEPNELAALEYRQMPDALLPHEAVSEGQGLVSTDGVRRWSHEASDGAGHAAQDSKSPANLGTRGLETNVRETCKGCTPRRIVQEVQATGLRSAHSRHDDVAQHEVNGRLVALQLESPPHEAPCLGAGSALALRGDERRPLKAPMEYVAMNIDLTWNERMSFTARAGDHLAQMDARPPLGTGNGMTPKELLLAALAGCTAMDVAGLLRKHKQPLERFTVRVDATPSEGDHPKVFSKLRVVFELTGPVDPRGALDAVRASQTQFCGISAMLSKAVPIEYVVIVNGEQVGTGYAQF